MVVPGNQGLSILMITVLGIVGSIVGGFLGYLIFHNGALSGFFQPAGIIGASIVLLIWNRTSGPSDAAPTSAAHLTTQGGREGQAGERHSRF